MRLVKAAPYAGRVDEKTEPKGYIPRTKDPGPSGGGL